MTEDEAKTKTCHRTLAPIHDATGGALFSPQACVGSDCMAWRVMCVDGHQQNAPVSDNPPEGEGWQRNHPTRSCGWWRQVPTRYIGYCGLAGRPE